MKLPTDMRLELLKLAAETIPGARKETIVDMARAFEAFLMSPCLLDKPEQQDAVSSSEELPRVTLSVNGGADEAPTR